MPCSFRIISEMLPEIHLTGKYNFLKHIIFLENFDLLLKVFTLYISQSTKIVNPI